MKTKTKQIIYTTFIGILSLRLILFSYNKYLSKKASQVGNEPIKVGSNMISLMLETSRGSGEYTESTSNRWPRSGYIYNETLSKCENGSILTYNSENNSVSVKTNKSDRCFIYFDVEPPNLVVAVNNAPSTATERKIGAVTCTSNGATYNQLYDRIEISNISNKYETCTLNYTNNTNKTYLNNYVTNLAGTTQGTGEVVNENGYRYEGKNPNNYIWFNNELWRIIGIFDESSHGQSGKNLVKIIRNESIGGLVWDKSNTNNWETSSLKSLLNGVYYNAQDGTSGDYCYGYYNAIKSNCDYRKIGIQTGYRGMIQNVTWYLGGAELNTYNVSRFYGYERGTTVYSGRPTSTTGYIGLMYPSDYGYSVLASSCARTTNLSYYSSPSCAGQSWLYGIEYEWTLMPISDGHYNLFALNYNGNLFYYSSQCGYAARPVLYLKDSVYYVDGDGSMLDPFIIGM